MAKFTWDAMYDELTPYYGGIPLWQSTQDMLDAFWLSRGFADAPQGDALYAFYVAQGAVGVTLGDLENDYWDRIGPNVLVGLGATLVLDARNSRVGEQWALNMGSGGQVLRAKYGSVARAEIRNGVGLVLSPAGVDKVTVPDAANLDIANNLEIVVRGSCDDLSGASSKTLFAKMNSSGAEFSWNLEFYGSSLYWIWSTGGTSATQSFFNGPVGGILTPGTTYWIKATIVGGVGAISWAADSVTEPTSWTVLAGSQTGSGTPIYLGSAPVSFGTQGLSNVTNNGIIKRGIVRSAGSTVLDVDFTKPADFTTSFVCDTGQTVTVTAANAVDTNDPLFLPWTGENYVNLSGISGNYVSTPDAAALDITGDIEFVARIEANDWTPSSEMTIIEKNAGVGFVSFAWRLAASGSLNLYLSNNGTTVVSGGSPSPVAISNGTAGWVKTTWRASDGLTSYYYAADQPAEPTVWTAIGTQTIAVGSINNSTSIVEFGTANTGTNAPFTGKFYRGIIRNGIGGTAVLDIDFTKNTSQSSFVCTTGQTVTINRATSGRKTVVVTRPVWLFGTDDYMEVADNALLNFGLTENYTILAVTRHWGTAGKTYAIFQKKVSIGTTVGWMLHVEGGTFYHSPSDGTNYPYVNLGGTVDGNLQVRVGVSDIPNDLIRSYNNSTMSSTTNTMTSGTSNTEPVRAGTNPTEMELFAVAVFRRALTPAEIAQIVAAFGAA